jgi:hypothetical protein
VDFHGMPDFFAGLRVFLCVRSPVWQPSAVILKG